MSQYPEILVFEGKFTLWLFGKNVGFRECFYGVKDGKVDLLYQYGMAIIPQKSKEN